MLWTNGMVKPTDFIFVEVFDQKVKVHFEVSGAAHRIVPQQLTEQAGFPDGTEHRIRNCEANFIVLGLGCCHRLGSFIAVIAVFEAQTSIAVFLVQKQNLIHSHSSSRALTAEISFSCVMSFCSKAAITSSSTVSFVMMWWMVTTCVWPCRQRRALVCW